MYRTKTVFLASILLAVLTPLGQARADQGIKDIIAAAITRPQHVVAGA